MSATEPPVVDAPAAPSAPPPPPPPPLGLLGPLLLAAVGAVVMVLREVEGPAADWLAMNASFEVLPTHALAHVDDLLLVPAASVLVVFCRITLGLRMLGPFRPILIGLAFYQTGIVPGTLFVASIMAAVALLRPRFGRAAVPYFGRLALLLAFVVVVELVVLLVGTHLAITSLVEAAVFPIIVLSLSADGFARVLANDGFAEALWRGVVTVGLAVAISALGNIDAVADFLFDYPEFVFVEVALVLVIATRMQWAWLDPQHRRVA